MIRIRTLGLALLAVFAFSAVAAASASATAGPRWKVNGAELKTGESKKILFKAIGATKLEVPAFGVTITCNKAEQSGATSNIKGNGTNPGTDEAVISFKECSTSATCKAFTAGEPEGTIKVSVNSELTYKTKVNAEEHKEPVGVLFRTKGNAIAEFVKIKFKGTGCLVAETTVNATGNAVGQIAGKGGVWCEITPLATTEAKVHTIKCVAAGPTKVFNWIGGVVKEHTLGLEAFGFPAKQVGEGEIELETKENYSVMLT